MRTSGRLLPALIVAAVLGVFAQVVQHGFTSFDDHLTLADNPALNPPSLEGIVESWRAPFMELYVPLTHSVWGLIAFAAYLDVADEQGIRLNPGIFHAANLLVHLATALLVFLLLRRLLGKEWAAAAGALMFAIHPVQVETVSWASGMKDLLCGLLSVTALYVYVQFATSPRDAMTRRIVLYTLATAAFGLATLSKPSAVTVPLMALILDRVLLGRPLRQVAAATLPWLGLAVACALWTMHWQPVSPVAAPPIWARPLIAADALAFYLSKILFPLELGIAYGRSPQTLFESHWVWVTWIVPLVLAGWLWFNRRHRVLTTASLLFFLALLPVLGFVPFEWQLQSTVADHYLYLPMVGVALGFGWLVSMWRGTTATAVVVGLLLMLGTRAWFQVRYWEDSVSLYKHALAVNPESAFAHSNLGVEYEGLGDRALRQGDEDTALDFYRLSLEHFAKAVAITSSLTFRNNYAFLLIKLMRYDEAEEQLGQVLELHHGRMENGSAPALDPKEVARAYMFLGNLRELQGNPAEASSCYRTATRIFPAIHESVHRLRPADTADPPGPLSEPSIQGENRKTSLNSSSPKR